MRTIRFDVFASAAEPSLILIDENGKIDAKCKAEKRKIYSRVVTKIRPGTFSKYHHIFPDMIDEYALDELMLF